MKYNAKLNGEVIVVTFLEQKRRNCYGVRLCCWLGVYSS
jgi:hypothetical protein